MIPQKISSVQACRVVGIDRASFNQHVAAGNYPCAPQATAGRPRMFDESDLLALRLFRDLLDAKVGPDQAGVIACAVAEAASVHLEEAHISYVERYIGSGLAMATSKLPAPDDWDRPLEGSDIRWVITFRVDKLRALIDHHAREERIASYFGE